MLRLLLCAAVMVAAAGCEQLFPPGGEEPGSGSSATSSGTSTNDSGATSGTSSSSGGSSSSGTTATSNGGTTSSASGTSGSSGSSGTSGGCGDYGQACCNNTDCNSADLYCDGYRCVSYWANWPMPNPASAKDPFSSAALPNPVRYVDGGSGTVVDQVTWLMWQGSLFNTEVEIWSLAASYCNTLRTGGYQDWRMPTEIELYSLLDFTADQPAATIDSSAFPDTPTESPFWSSTLQVPDSGYAWSVKFSNGEMAPYDEGATAYVRCVRGGPAPVAAPRYSSSASGTLQDRATGLTWDLDASASLTPWADAGSSCATLALDGLTWRLPSVKELATLVDFRVGYPGPAVDSQFSNTPQSTFWSSSQGIEDGGLNGMAWTVSFSTSDSASFSTGEGYYFRCVH